MEDNKKVYYALVAGGVLLVLAVCWFLLREPDVHDQRDAARDVEQSLDRAGAEQQRAVESAERIQSGLERSVVVIERIEERTGNAESAVGRAASGNEAARRIVEDSQRRVAECAGIIQEIRAGAGQN